MQEVKSIAVLMTCFNRKEKTIICLDNLYRSNMQGVHLDIYLVDDGSTDGTSLLIKEKYPNVNVIEGTGSLYWNGGMRLAWSESLIKGYDFYLWINDDSMIYRDSIVKIVECYNKIQKGNECPGAVIGTMVDPVTKEKTYGGRVSLSNLFPIRSGDIIDSSELPVRCDFINGNFTLIPHDSVDKVGILNERFTHSMGDFDYGLRLIKSGMSCWVAPGVYGECQNNPIEGGCKDKNLSIDARLKKMQMYSQLPPPKEWKYFVRHHGGIFWPILWLKTHLREKFPKLWVLIRSR
ncbi:glycosyltransferase family 2 protein [Aliiglaciecola lipolytica]|uniref:glycosyltransferase family 2 protein n=1 Tax=Aliiglaciecola lipolytica TaxID=477689 RepID=UPI001C08FA07|nr:glycosyltransferase family 2 protein [Aliiglaciecola lipolytica]MBU2880307.1 glycosyltransferase family 2 protein [Aliiglaciecola lipolytica]